MKIKWAVSNALILVSPGDTTTVCNREKFLKIRVPSLAKIGFVTCSFVICCQTEPIFVITCIIDTSTKTL